MESHEGTRNKIVLSPRVIFAQKLGCGELLEKLSSEKSDLLDFTYISTVRPNGKLSEHWTSNVGRVLLRIEKHDSELGTILGEYVSPDNSIFYLCGYDW